MTSLVKVNSNVVPIDISGKPFSRMASFRRSLIHVDFLIRRKKKKDKRRNTVAEGEAKDALSKFIANDNQCVQNSNSLPGRKLILAPENFNEQNLQELSNNGTAERNNNTDSLKNPKCITVKEIELKLEDNVSALTDSSQVEFKNTDTVMKLPYSKRKSKSNIPISTVSAAMSVAVEMRQSNDSKSDDHSSSGNWSCSSDQNSTDSDKKISENNDSRISFKAKGNLKTENINHCKENLESNSSSPNNKKISSKEKYEIEDPDVSSSTSSEIDKFQDDFTSINTSTESDAFFISSDESDEYLSDMPFTKEKHGSSTSLSTLSDRSLNSLLSQTGTEITSSTGTLTSIGEEKILIPPPPPKIVAASTIHEIEDPKINLTSKKCETDKHISKQILSKKYKKLKHSHKESKSIKEIPKKHHNSTENSKNLFTSLVNIKTNAKEKHKLQGVVNKRQNKLHAQPVFDMYGSSSPKKPKELKVFTVENTPQLQENNIKVPMKSFSSHQLRQDTGEINEFTHCHTNRVTQRTSLPSNVSEPKLHVKVEKEPLKYEHSIKVTPIQRHTNAESSGKTCTPFLHDINNEEQNPQSNTNIKNMRNDRKNSINSEKRMSYSNKANPMCSISPLLEKPKLAAHVVLDFDGKVIYCTNSLDRKNASSVINNVYSSKHPANLQDFVTQNKDESPYHRPCSLQLMQSNSTSSFTSNRQNSISNSNFVQKPRVENVINNSWIAPQNSLSDTQTFVKTSNVQHNRILIGKKDYALKNSMLNDMSNPLPTMYSYADNKNISAKYFLPPDPNISGLPDQEILLTQYNVNMHSKRMERLSLSSDESNANNSYENEFLKLSLNQKTAEISEKATKPPQSTMSTEDLFAVIHSCKKRLNIKTDSDISLASSSRSSSPSYVRPSSSKGTLAETGFLSPRNQTRDTPGYRRSWADFRSSEGSERKSLASDRLGPTKPTSMHDFKMLLLQARSSNKTPGPRRSAVEMLKISSPQETTNRINELPYNLSPRNSISFPVQNSSPELFFPNGHSTVPFKRGNRTRSSLQTKYTIYPPIFEDCSEEYENCHDLNVQNPTFKTLKDIENEVGNKPANTSINCNGRLQNSRHWI